MTCQYGSFTGNPLAVVGNANNLSTTQMQNIARWLNLSETAFLSAPTTTDADIFTRTEEPPFAGHPTLGSARAWLEFGGNHKDTMFSYKNAPLAS
ncbi:PhzF family phenazine biosynthesis isomerase [Corynebacterium rouxii]|uniref:PhzF family phenazine biosynthesis isomerase n=1 Tax=Corynebacterium rouxii TaxID=2719119 RepID=A0ABU3PJF8_9CORY|nr:PhzF family phenazine biosynthesis isomerase [Corynebacterium rouxii]MDT9407793.1 PhzF family phenazine biosynthesis isomerase [Corynebacterium rouxii]MDT9409975.1 PhzF family phenazine biosynthesis isomerase [Corynebacterium rouxii]